MIVPISIAGVRGRRRVKPWCLTPTGTKVVTGFKGWGGRGEKDGRGCAKPEARADVLHGWESEVRRFK